MWNTEGRISVLRGKQDYMISQLPSNSKTYHNSMTEVGNREQWLIHVELK